MFSKYLIVIFASSLAFSLTIATVKFTNIKCEELQPSFATISKCKLKMVQRGVAALDIYVKLNQLPVTNVSVRYIYFNHLFYLIKCIILGYLRFI